MYFFWFVLLLLRTDNFQVLFLCVFRIGNLPIMTVKVCGSRDTNITGYI